MDYSPFNPVIWLIAAGVVALAYLTVKVYHAKYPHYPNEEPGMEKRDPD